MIAVARTSGGAITDPELVRDLKYLVKLMNRELAQHLFRSFTASTTSVSEVQSLKYFSPYSTADWYPINTQAKK